MKIESLTNNKVKTWNKLKEKKYRDETGLFLIEGDHLIKEALKRNLVVSTIGLTSDYDFEVTSEILKKLSCQKSGTNEIAIVKKIEDENCPKKVHWYMIVDGSTNGISRIEKIYTSNIIDIEVMRKANQTATIGSPMDSSRIVSMRLVGDILQVTQDGTNWISVVKVPQSESGVIVEPEDQELAAKIARLIPKRIPPERRMEMIENLVSLYNEELKKETNKEEDNSETNTDMPSTPDDTPSTGGDSSVTDTPTTGDTTDEKTI